MIKKDVNKYPKGWNRKRVERTIAHDDSQTEMKQSPKPTPRI